MSQQFNVAGRRGSAFAALEAERIALPTKPLWLVRLELLWKGFKNSLALFAENKIGLVGIAIILFFGIMAVAHPILMATVWKPAIYDPVRGYDITQVAQPAPPSLAHPLGTDPLGRDILSQLMYSARWEFALGLVAALVTVILATSVGAISAYFGGVVDAILMRVADVMIMLPLVTVLIVLSALRDVTHIDLAVMIGLLAGLGGAAIIIKSQALTIKVRTYIEAARVAGGNDFHIILRHIVPNLLPLSFLYMMFTVTEAIFAEAVLSFFGLLNIRMSWGLMIHTAETAGYLLDMKTWWLIYPASLAITLLCSAFYLVGRAMDEVVNPRLRRR